MECNNVEEVDSGSSRSSSKTAESEDIASSGIKDDDPQVETGHPISEGFPPPAEIRNINKLLKFIKYGDPTATVLSLLALVDCCKNRQEVWSAAIRRCGGVPLLLNCLDTDVLRCQVASLQVLERLTRQAGRTVIRQLVRMRGVPSVVCLLMGPLEGLRMRLAALTLAHLAEHSRRARKIAFREGAIPQLLELLKVDESVVARGPTTRLTQAQTEELERARCAATALWALSKSARNRRAIRKSGGLPVLVRLLQSDHYDALVPVAGIMQHCASEGGFLYRRSGVTKEVCRHLSSPNAHLQMLSAGVVFKCAEADDETQELIGRGGGIQALTEILSNQEHQLYKEMMMAASGAVWKCLQSQKNVMRLKAINGVELLSSLLHSQPEEVLVNVVGALSFCAGDVDCCSIIRRTGGLATIVSLLTNTNDVLLTNIALTIRACADEPMNMSVIHKLHGVRLLWSQLKSGNDLVLSSTAWALYHCILNTKGAGHLVCSLVGGMELLVQHLRLENPDVQASVCAVVSVVASDPESLDVLTDLGIVSLLSQLSKTSDEQLRRQVAKAVASCCTKDTNRVGFGKAVKPLTKYLQSRDTEVNRQAVFALKALSENCPENCSMMHKNGLVGHLLKFVGFPEEEVQEAAVCCLCNIRQSSIQSA